MRKLLIFITLLFPAVLFAQDTPQPEGPINRIVDVAVPNVWNVKITLESGEVIEIQKVALTQRNLERKLTVRMFFSQDIRVVHEGKLRVIKATEVEKMEFSKVRDEPKPEPTPTPVKKPDCN